MLPIRRGRVSDLRSCTLVLICLLALLKVTVLLNVGLPPGWLGGSQEALALELETPEEFLERYTAYCERELRPKAEKRGGGGMAGPGQAEGAERWENMRVEKQIKVCPCVPDTLVGPMNDSAAPPTVLTLMTSPGGVGSGGRWAPEGCLARQKVAVIVPYRDREGHLATLLSVLHPMLQRQQLDYRVFVVEQTSPELFNKAMLMNAGFSDARHYAPFDCYVFHDVDMIPEDDRNFYTCARSAPRHVGSHLAQYGYTPIYAAVFGGVTAFTRQQFETANGFSNTFYGWGGEDDDMYNRVRTRGFKVVRFPRSIARYHMLEHMGDTRNPHNAKASVGLMSRGDHYLNDGLSTLNYTLARVSLRPLYTHILIALPPPPARFKTFDRWHKERSYVNLVTLGVLFVALLAGIVWDDRRRTAAAAAAAAAAAQ